MTYTPYTFNDRVHVHDEFNKENREWLHRLRWNFGHNWALLGG